MALTEAEELELLELEEQEALARGNTPGASRGGPSEPRPSQADVRASEPPIALAAQEADERGYNAALQAWLQTPAGRPYALYPYNDPIKQRAAFSRATGRSDPSDVKVRERSKIEHARETGEVVYDDNPAYKIAKPLASMAGFAFGGPAGATFGEAGVRALALTENLTLAVKHGAIDEERAQQIFKDEMKKGTAVDAAWNVGTPVAVDAIGWLLQKVPGATWLKGLADKAMGKKDMRPEKIAERAALAKTPAGAQAVKEISNRLGADRILTPGQVTGEAPIGEIAARTAHPKVFTKGEEAVDQVVEGMRRDALYPVEQPQRKAIGERIIDMADETVASVKKRLRPTFDAADELGIRVDFSDVEKTAREALAKAERVPGNSPQQVKEMEALRKLVAWFDDRAARDGTRPLEELKGELDRLLASRNAAKQEWGKFKTFEEQQKYLAENFHPVPGQPRVPGQLSAHPERAAEGAKAAQEAEAIARKRLEDANALLPKIAQLQQEIGALEGRPLLRAEDALDFIKDQKAVLRATPEWTPSTRFETMVGDFMRKADEAFNVAATKSGNAGLVKDLNTTRTEYRHMMETVFDDAMKAALKKGGSGAPEDIGQYLWQNGKVSRIEQLDELLKLGQKEGAFSRAAADKMRRDVTRGFLQEAVKNVDDAATFSKRLAEQPRLAETWEVLTASPAGKQLKDTMAVLEEAAKIARNNNSKLADTLGVGAIPVARAARGGLGVSYVTGVLHPGMAVVGLSIDASTRMMATAYTQGNKGALNSLVKVLRLRDVSTPAATQALRAALADVEKFAAENNITDIFVGAAEEVDDFAEGNRKALGLE